MDSDAASLMDRACTTYIHGIVPELTGEDEGVDMSDQPDRTPLDGEGMLGLIRDFNRDMVGILKDWSAASRAAEAKWASDQPDRVGSEGAD